MGIFSKPEVIILKESNDAKEHLDKLESLLPKANKDVKDKIQKEIAVTKAGIAGEDNIMFELKHSNMDICTIARRMPSCSCSDFTARHISTGE